MCIRDRCEEELNAVPPRAQLHRICGSLSGLDRRIRSALRQQRAERERRAFRPRQVSWKGAKRAALLAAVLLSLIHIFCFFNESTLLL